MGTRRADAELLSIIDDIMVSMMKDIENKFAEE